MKYDITPVSESSDLPGDIDMSWNIKTVVEVTIRYNTSQVVRSKCFMSEQQRMIERIKGRNFAFTKMIN